MKQILICVLLQFILFIPFYILWKKDCKEIGKDNLALSLQERFLIWCWMCPIWALGFID